MFKIILILKKSYLISTIMICRPAAARDVAETAISGHGDRWTRRPQSPPSSPIVMADPLDSYCGLLVKILIVYFLNLTLV